ncbi:DEAD/DEAH box helicase family protein [Streptomyces sp. AM 4-1-1]|uniref:DEAD/DEAH box helicase family protein n=1 Tax=Streptomyces sp. AM 4-1-1 TaxID=3028710 RepID=UPI0023B929CF|nr:DEAD/DEAH box helicase family protein [Streptomyces sp. AM 4-1-1]WEH36082.1 DEAD/DEAH box helicase family protein [Streptomyces sp. AM 4-1-1]
MGSDKQGVPDDRNNQGAEERRGGRTASAVGRPPGNFAFLRAEWPALHAEAAHAERLVYADPRAACFYARRVLEQAAHWMYDKDPSLRAPHKTDLAAMLHEPTFRTLVGPAVNAKMDIIRRQGNHAVHKPAPATPQMAVVSVRELFHSLYWFARTYARQVQDLPAAGMDFDTGVIPRPLSPEARLRKQAELKAEEEADRRRYKQQAEELAAERERNEDQARQIAELRARIAAAKTVNQAVRDTHDYDEAATRDAFVDLLLKEAGWDGLRPGTDTEYPVTGMPTKTGKGYVDYVLWGDDGRPLAVVEAKRTRRDAREGQQQARLYADALAARFDGHRPVIFYTNGYETYLWDDGLGHPPRTVQGFLTQDQLRWRIMQRAGRKSLSTTPVNEKIAGRPYQLRAVRRVGDAFERDKQRQALLVMATGTGKTRTTVALVDQLKKAGWAQRVLFLADRQALVNQTVKAFKEHLPNTPVASLLDDKEASAHVFVSTYQTMMRQIDATDATGRRRFGPGYFDLIVIDEAHRSVYDKYAEIFRYFDSLLLGLTATPKDEIDRNTYRLFQLEDGVPTDSYGLDEAVEDGYLVPAKPVKVPLRFMERGIRYDDLSEEEKAEWDAKEWSEDGDVPDAVSRHEMNKFLFNADTVDKMLQVLMTHGDRVEGGDRIGKTIVFAKNNDHARFIEERFNANYPRGAGHTARVITYKETYAQSLIEKFSDPADRPDIAISVDMLDTGVDVPEVVNLVFAKPVFSKTKFWQMIGRGTRLRPRLYGPDDTNPAHAKRNFRVFDFCGNIDFFNSGLAPVEGRRAVSLSERLLRRQLDLVRALDRREQPDPARDGGADAAGTEAEVRWSTAHRLHRTVAGMNRDNFLVRPHRREAGLYADFANWHRIDDDADAAIRGHLLALPSEFHPDEKENGEEAKRFDLMAYGLQLAALEGGREYAKLRGGVQEIAGDLLGKTNIPAVAAQAALLEAVSGDDWWQDATLPMLEQMRRALRVLVRLTDDKAKRKVVFTDFEDELGEMTEAEIRGVPVGTDEQRFRQKARVHLLRHEDQPAVRKLRHNEQITQEDLAALEEDFLAEAVASPDDLDEVRAAAGGLGVFVRSVCGIDRDAARGAFAEFIAARRLSAAQLDFVDLIIQVVAKRGNVEIGDLYEGPFTDRASGGPGDLFEEEAIDGLITVFQQLRTHALALTPAG